MNPTSNDALLPVIAGLVAGIALIAAFSAAFPHGSLVRSFFPHAPHPDELFVEVEQVPEVRLFLEKYNDTHSDQNHLAKGFSRQPDGSASQYLYSAFRNLDMDGDGYTETLRRVELSIIFEGDRGNNNDSSNNAPRVRQMEIHCLQLSSEEPRSFADLFSPAFDGSVGAFIEGNNCLA